MSQARPNLNSMRPSYPRIVQQRFAKRDDLSMFKEDFDPDRDIVIVRVSPCYDPPKAPPRPEKPQTKIDTTGMDRIIAAADKRRGLRFKPPALTLPPELYLALEIATLLSTPFHAAAWARGDYY